MKTNDGSQSGGGGGGGGGGELTPSLNAIDRSESF